MAWHGKLLSGSRLNEVAPRSNSTSIKIRVFFRRPRSSPSRRRGPCAPQASGERAWEIGSAHHRPACCFPSPARRPRPKGQPRAGALGKARVGRKIRVANLGVCPKNEHGRFYRAPVPCIGRHSSSLATPRLLYSKL